jgi:putative ABC transport system permease protein
MELIKRDVVYAFRTLARRPGFAAVALLTIALGIGINTAIFSIINAVLLRPLPFRDPDRIVSLFTVLKEQGGERDIFSPPNFLDLQARTRSLDSASALLEFGFDLTNPQSEPEAIPAARVSSEFFRVLGVKPFLGRTFSKDEDRPGNERVVVLSYRFWREHFGSNPGIVGHTISLNEKPYTVLGVMPAQFQLPQTAKLWAPIAFSDEQKTYRGNTTIEAIGRLKPDISLDQAKADLHTVASALEKEYPQYNRAKDITAIPLHEFLVGDTRPVLLMLGAAVGFVLLIACGNLANLLIANASTRTREFAVRTALGASRSRLLRQLMTESLTLSLIGGVIGTLLSLWVLPTLKSMAPAQLPRIAEIGLDWRVLLFTFGISVLTGLLFGLAPALGFSRTNLQQDLKDGQRGTGAGMPKRRFGNAMIVAEVSLVLVLLTGAGLMIRSFLKLTSVNPGFKTDNVQTFELNLPPARYEETEKRLFFIQALTSRIQSLPGVRSVDIVAPAPFTAETTVIDVSYRVKGVPVATGQYDDAFFTRVTANYFKDMQIPLLAGRPFSANDSANAPQVCIVSESFARKHWPRQNAVGRQILIGQSSPLTLDVIGVVKDVKHLTLNNQIQPEIYMHFMQRPSINFLSVLVQTEGNSSPLTAAIKKQVWTIDKNLPVRYRFKMEDLINRSIAPSRISTFLISAFAAVALLLAVIGLYGLIAYSVTVRTKEIGIRVALGAKRNDILKLIVRNGMLLAAVGLMIGLVASFLLSRFISSLLFEVRPNDPLVYVWVSGVLLVTALIACYLPARRAAKLDAISALRYQ